MQTIRKTCTHLGHGSSFTVHTYLEVAKIMPPPPKPQTSCYIPSHNSKTENTDILNVITPVKALTGAKVRVNDQFQAPIALSWAKSPKHTFHNGPDG